jgi:phospholipid/cholesterol/gamma-HCH transport system substrate-binding protein
MKRALSTLMTVALIAAAAGAFVLTRSDKETYEVTAEVTQAPNLFDGGRVMVRGVKIGTITEVEPRPGGVLLTMELDAAVPVPADARLSIVPITIIADRYVQFFPAYTVGATLQNGDHIPEARTVIPAELEDVLAQLKGLLAALEPKPGERNGPLARLINSLDQAVDGRSEALAGTLTGSASVLENLADSEADITALIENLDVLFAALAGRASEIGIVNERFELVAEALLADQANLEGTIENLALLSGEAALLVDESGDELGEAFGRLDHVLTRILAHEESLSEGVRLTNVIAQALGATDASGRGLYAYTGRQAPVGSKRAQYNYRIDSRDTLSCERVNETAQTVFAITPSATEADVLQTIQSFIPDFYDPHLKATFESLVSLCVDQFLGRRLDSQATRTVRGIAREVGRERFSELLALWLFEGLHEGALP